MKRIAFLVDAIGKLQARALPVGGFRDVLKMMSPRFGIKLLLLEEKPLLFPDAEGREDQVQDVVAGSLARERVEMTKGSV
jgi:hypothetical protein